MKKIIADMDDVEIREDESLEETLEEYGFGDDNDREVEKIIGEA